MAETREQFMNTADVGAENADKGKTAADWVSEKAQGVKDTATEMAGAVGTKARETVRNVTEAAGRAKDRVTEWVSDQVEPAQEFMGEAYATSRDAVANFGRTLTDVIRAYPLAALAVGFGLGLILGRTASRN
jgi:phage-related tail protein